MSVYRYRYEMRISFGGPVTNHSFKIKCLPQDNCRQKILSCLWEVEPDVPLKVYRDWAGNAEAHGFVSDPHEVFSFTVSGEAETANDICESKGDASPVYRYETPLTAAGEGLKAFFAAQDVRPDAPYDAALALMHATHGALRYEKGETDVATSAEEAFERGSGVCQDYAHVMLSLCRLAGLPSKYVVGFIPGEGESHAWVEVQCRGYWYGFDPTNDLLVSDGYIKISEGRDFSDTEINRGCFRGAVSQEKQICVLVEKS